MMIEKLKVDAKIHEGVEEVSEVLVGMCSGKEKMMKLRAKSLLPCFRSHYWIGSMNSFRLKIVSRGE